MNEPLPSYYDAPIRPGEEWANALSHGLAAVASPILAYLMVTEAATKSTGLAIACAAYGLSVFATFTCSTLSHVILRQPLLNTLRAADQAVIYAMISGTYTPIIYRFAPDAVALPLLIAIWVAAFAGMGAKLFLRHRVNNVTTITYLLLGWLPSIPIFNKVPSGLGWGMLLGGVLYSLGVIVLMNDHRKRYLHVVWHVFVITAALCHYSVIWKYVLA